MINKEEIMQLTEDYRGVWGINHSRHLLDLISIIGENQNYNEEVVWLAAYLHDWSGYSHWRKEGFDHAIRSKEVAEDYLLERGYPQELIAKVLECIETHLSAKKGRSIEAQLISDADALEFLGCVGMMRMFSMKPRDLRAAYEIAKKNDARNSQESFIERNSDRAS